MTEDRPPKMAGQTGDPRIGVYLCRCGGNISDVVDLERVAELARRIPGVVIAKIETFMCSDPGQKTIEDDIHREGLDAVVVASCSPALHELTFRGAVARGGLNPYLYEHVNIREQCSWAHKHDPDGATAKAARMVAGAVGKLHHAAPLEQIRLPNEHKAVVIGGGIAGMKAALDMAERGIAVTLIEQSDRLGGRLNALGCVFPSENGAGLLIARLRQQIDNQPLIEVHLRAEVVEVTGFVGNFTVTIQRAPEPNGSGTLTRQTAGAIVVATGNRLFEPSRNDYAYGRHSAVITLADFIHLIDAADPAAKSLMHDGKPVRSVALLHCVGSRQVEGVNQPQSDGKINPYCSRVCCTTTLQQAARCRHRFPETTVYDLHQDIRTYGRRHEAYYEQASQAGVIFFRWHGEEPPTVEVDAGRSGNRPPLTLTVKDYLTWGEELTMDVDLLVLATGMMPNRIERLGHMLKLPVGDDRFLQEIHPKLRPVETSVNGVLLAGTAQAPMTIEESLQAAGAAAAKVSAMFAHEHVELDPYVAHVDSALCDGCGRCIEACNYDGAIQLGTPPDDVHGGKRAEVNAGLCVGCGVCVAVCPRRAIDLQGWTLAQYEAMVDGIVADIPLAAAGP